MGWPEVCLYLGVSAVVIAAAALKVVDSGQASSAITMIIAFVVGRKVPSPKTKEEKKEGEDDAG